MFLVVINIVALICAVLSNTNDNDIKPFTNTIESTPITQTRIATVETKPIVTCMPTTAVTTTNIATTNTTCTTKEDSVIEQEITTKENEEIYYGWFEATYYEGGYGTYGASGRDLISGYSIASNVLEQGTIVRITGSGLDGIYRVDDTGGMPNHVIDVYYQYGDTPDYFQLYGRLDIEVYIMD